MRSCFYYKTNFHLSNSIISVAKNNFKKNLNREEKKETAGLFLFSKTFLFL